jgi:hypothetical protein
MKSMVLIALVLGLAVTGSAAAAKPVVGSVSGPVTAVKGTTFKVKTTLSPTGTATISVGSATTITEQVAGTTASVKTGICVMATGQKNAKGVVTAARLSITEPVKGSCTTGFGAGRRGNRPPGAGGGGGGAPPAGSGGGGFGNSANFGFAFGQVTSVKGDSVKVKGTTGTTSVTLAKTTQISQTETVKSSAIAVKSCAFVNGSSTDKGVTVKATDVRLTKPNKGSCTFGFRTR